MQESTCLRSGTGEPSGIPGLRQGRTDSSRTVVCASHTYPGLHRGFQPGLSCTDALGDPGDRLRSRLAWQSRPRRPAVSLFHDIGVDSLGGESICNLAASCHQVDLTDRQDFDADVPSVQHPTRVECAPEQSGCGVC